MNLTHYFDVFYYYFVFYKTFKKKNLNLKKLTEFKQIIKQFVNTYYYKKGDGLFLDFCFFSISFFKRV